MLKDWGFIFKDDGYEYVTFNKTDYQTRIAGVETVEQAIEIACGWAEDGIQLIELCGWFREEGANQLVEAVGDKVAIGYVIENPKTEKLKKKIFAE